MNSKIDNNKVAILVKKAALEFDKISNSYFLKYELTASQFKILKYLYSTETGKARVTDIENYYSLTHPTTIGLIDYLEKKNFIERVDNPNDKRGKLVSLTSKAREMEEELILVGNSIEKELTNSLTDKEKEELINLLNKLLRK